MPVAGEHTVHELADLWSAYSFELAALNKAAAAAANAWRAADPEGYLAFTTQQSLFTGYVASTVVPALSPVFAGASKTSTPSWDATLATSLDGDVFAWLVQQWADGPPGGVGFNALDAMMRASPVKAQAPSYVGMPQPTAPDFDLQAYGLADKAWKAVKRAASSTAGVLVPLIIIGAGAWYLLSRRK